MPRVFIRERPVSRQMFNKNSLLAAVRCTLPEREILSGRGNDWTIVSNNYLLTSEIHFSNYKQVGLNQNYRTSLKTFKYSSCFDINFTFKYSSCFNINLTFSAFTLSEISMNPFWSSKRRKKCKSLLLSMKLTLIARMRMKKKIKLITILSPILSS